MIEHKPPTSATPSLYVSSWLAKIIQSDQCQLRLCLDLASGYGRHSILASKYFETVVAIDNSETVSTSKWYKKYKNISYFKSDLSKPLPFYPSQVDLVLLIHYYDENIVDRIWKTLKVGGIIILETVDNRGGNWQELPLYQEFLTLLSGRFQIIHQQLKWNKKEPTRVSVKTVLQKT
jgi:SAM-dependent methyltransferase